MGRVELTGGSFLLDGGCCRGCCLASWHHPILDAGNRNVVANSTFQGTIHQCFATLADCSRCIDCAGDVLIREYFGQAI